MELVRQPRVLRLVEDPAYDLADVAVVTHDLTLKLGAWCSVATRGVLASCPATPTSVTLAADSRPMTRPLITRPWVTWPWASLGRSASSTLLSAA